MGRALVLLMFGVIAIGGGYFALQVFTGETRVDLAAAEGGGEGTLTHIVVGIDLSQSNVIVSDEAFARKVADRIRPMLEGLGPRSLVSLRTFGSYGNTAGQLSRDWVISARNRPEDVATFVHGVIAGVPQLVARGQVESQGYTNIIAFMENTAQIVDCRDYEVIVILATDGVEDSEYVRLQNANAHLPEPERIFRGCDDLYMFGIGQGLRSPSTTARLRDEWETWADTAGFRRFVGLNDW